MLLYDMKRAFRLKNMVMSSVCLLMLSIIIRFETIKQVFEAILEKETLQYGWTLEFVLDTLGQEKLIFLLPLLSAFPFAAAYEEERRCGLQKLAISRVEKRYYLRSKMLTVAISGGAIVVGGAVALFVVACVMFRRYEAAPCMGEYSKISEYGKLLMRYFLFGALWAELGLFFSTLLNQKVMAWLSPFMTYYLLIIGYERYFSMCHILYPIEWIRGAQGWPTDWSCCLWMGILLCVVGLNFYTLGTRRLQYV